MRVLNSYNIEDDRPAIVDSHYGFGIRPTAEIATSLVDGFGRMALVDGVYQPKPNSFPSGIITDEDLGALRIGVLDRVDSGDVKLDHPDGNYLDIHKSRMFLDVLLLMANNRSGLFDGTLEKNIASAFVRAIGLADSAAYSRALKEIETESSEGKRVDWSVGLQGVRGLNIKQALQVSEDPDGSTLVTVGVHMPVSLSR